MKSLAGRHNGITTEKWIRNVKEHIRHLENAINRGDEEGARRQAWCVRSTVSHLAQSASLPPFEEDVWVESENKWARRQDQ